MYNVGVCTEFGQLKIAVGTMGQWHCIGRKNIVMQLGLQIFIGTV